MACTLPLLEGSPSESGGNRLWSGAFQLSNRVLIVEDDIHLAAMVKDFLAGEGYEVFLEKDGTQAKQRIVAEAFDAVVLDIGLPGMNGFDVCRAVRPYFDGPIIVLTARGDEVDEVVALEVGADDFISKPVRPRILLARLKSHLRRADSPYHSDAADVVVVGDLTVNSGSREVSLADKPVELTTAEFDLLEYLARHAGQVVPRKDIYISLLQIPYDGLDRSIDLRISRLRKKLGDDSHTPARIKSVRGVGYLLAK